MKDKNTEEKTVETVAPIPSKRVISIRNAKVNNLKSVSVDIPRNKLTVITGVSGSGKSSLAFDTLYAEGQRRFVESLSSYARQFLDRMSKPDVESITGIPPAIAIEQKTLTRNPRSTVGTQTECYDYLRLLFGRIGTTRCYKCDKAVRKDTPVSAIDDLLAWKMESKIYVTFPLAQHGLSLEECIMKANEIGYQRIVRRARTAVMNVTDGLDQFDEFPLSELFVLVDRLVLRKDVESKTRIADSLEVAFNYGGGKVMLYNLDTGEELLYSNVYECATCEITYQEPEPRLFSFNNPYGACPTCQGFGRSVGIDQDLVIPDRSKSIRFGAIHAFQGAFVAWQKKLMAASLKAGIPTDIPTSGLDQTQWNTLWQGGGDWEGIDKFFVQLEQESYKMSNRVTISRYRGYTVCTKCHGSRLRTSARQVFVSGKTIPDIVKMNLAQAAEFFTTLKLTKQQEHIAGQILREIRWRLQLLNEIGLEYLSLDRLSHTLSGGESQRINLASSIGSALVGTLYVLDEPSIGLHSRDTARLITLLKKLRSLGNTVVVVEHDLEIMQQADNIIDMGPKAGELGGEVVAQGHISEISLVENSLTAQYLTGVRRINIPAQRRKGNGKWIEIFRPVERNLKGDNVRIPLGTVTVVTGVSGSGKSTLIHDVLYGNLSRLLAGQSTNAGRCEKIAGYDFVKAVEMIDQSPIGRSSRSTPVTYTGAFDVIREIFSLTPLARQSGITPGYFSFNIPGGRCDACEGEGSQTVEMQFLPDIELECEHCRGARYKKEAQNYLYNGKSIVDVLRMTIDEAVEFFSEKQRAAEKLKMMQDVGLGYLRLGQRSTVLSGGEAQRIKLAAALDVNAQENTLYIFDEPTTGLHLEDISTLLKCFDKLIEVGHSVVIIEHNLHVIASADWVIDLGPEGGDRGGRLVAEGTPEQIAKVADSYTGIAIKQLLKQKPPKE